MLDGESAIRDLDRTEANRSLVATFTSQVLIDRQLDQLGNFVRDDLIQHNPDLPDGANALRNALGEAPPLTPPVRYHRLHRVLCEGNFALAMCEGACGGRHGSFYDLYRIDDGRIVEHWDTIETIAPRAEWKNENGKF